MLFQTQISFLPISSKAILHYLPTLSPCFREAALPASPQSVCLGPSIGMSVCPFRLFKRFIIWHLSTMGMSQIKQKVHYTRCFLMRPHILSVCWLVTLSVCRFASLSITTPHTTPFYGTSWPWRDSSPYHMTDKHVLIGSSVSSFIYPS